MNSVSDLFDHFNLDTKYLEYALLKTNISIKVVGFNDNWPTWTQNLNTHLPFKPYNFYLKRFSKMHSRDICI